MTLEKLTITPRKPSNLQPIKVLFNPTSYSISKSVSWEPPRPPVTSGTSTSKVTNREFNAPLLEFGGGGSRVLTLNLFFDVTEEASSGRPRDVRNWTNKFVALTRIERVGNDGQQPPVCDITWGDGPPKNSDFPFTGVVTSLNQDFTLFENTGRPVRANLSVSFKEFLVPEKDKRDNDPEFTTRVVKRGDTLSGIAAEMYNNSLLWRVIADANNLADPRRLEIGMALNIPKIR
ncbi:MAG: LysM peptidoglycan-binding domain-containing protein [Pyrinomonadaceae bacterium]